MKKRVAMIQDIEIGRKNPEFVQEPGEGGDSRCCLSYSEILFFTAVVTIVGILCYFVLIE